MNQNDSENNNQDLTYNLHKSINMEVLLNQIMTCFISIINEISFCKYILFKELVKVKVTEKYNNTNQSNKEELKKRFYKIEEMKQRDFLNLMMIFDSKTASLNYLDKYINSININSSFYGTHRFNSNL